MIPVELANAIGSSLQFAQTWADPITEAAARYHFAAAPRLAMFLAQAAYESMGFRRLSENLNYSVTGLLKVFPRFFPDNDPKLYARRPKEIANLVYGGRYGNVGMDDGWKYRGRGIFQITFKANYEACGNDLHLDLLNNPDKLLEPRYAALSAGWYWHSHGLNRLATNSEIGRVTFLISGSKRTADNRRILWHRAKVALGI